jgi:hypothetical protein
MRLARASAGKLIVRATPSFGDEWRKIDPGIADAPLFANPYAICAMPEPTALWQTLEQCLLQYLDKGLQSVVATNQCSTIGPIHPDLAATLLPTWNKWRQVIDNSPDIRRDFLRLLVRVEPAGSDTWDGDVGAVPNLVAALVLMLATHASEELTPAQCIPGNLTFATHAVGLGSGCDRIRGTPIADLQDAEVWSVDALILSGATEEMFANPGFIGDGGSPTQTLLRPTRVSPAVVQNTRLWRDRLKAGLEKWKAAVASEFSNWRARQDAQLRDESNDR